MNEPCDTPRRSRDARHVVRGTGDGGEASSRAQACMALTLIAWEGLGPTFRSTANAGDARLRSAAAAGVSRTPKATPDARETLSLSFVMPMGAAGQLAASRVPRRDI